MRRLPRSLWAPLAVLNGGFVVMLITLGPRYGWLVMVIIGAAVSAANIAAIRRAR
ncbi:MAG TPA: hypothetical protein VGN32_15790 [Ktedonobacterales bacterium]|jgi:hypothetical protein|nr:hypothetical protein [Ktedonobacterales bacterium]